MNGGDLRFHISRKTFTEEAVRFWIAELGCALRHIHKQGIVHRDVKPDNILLDSEGHVHLADFNVASDFTPSKPLTSKSGTLAYLAPEVYLNKGYLSEVDWWSLGVTFYECMYNKRPFEANNHDALAQAIIKGEAPFPNTSPPVSRVCLHAVSSLLEKDRRRRIGASSFESFTDNPFFRELDFNALERKELEPVYLPSSEKTNFDASYDLEELLLEEAPLEARAKKQKPRAELREDATRQEIRTEELHRMIETMFEPFDYTLLSDDRAPAEPREEADDMPLPAVAREKVSEETQQRQRLQKPRSASTTRPQTPSGKARIQTPAHSPTGSPPLPANLTSSEYFPPPTPLPRSNPPAPNKTSQTGARATSKGDGAQPDVVRPSKASSSATEEASRKGEKPTGMLGFLSRKTGRDKSPKARERGVLGREGARVILKEPKS